MKHALGFLEVRGLVAGIECADVMLKAASVRLATQITTNPALITLIVEGDIGSCRAAIDAGRLAAERQGALVSEKVIGRPEPDLALFVNTRQRWKTPAVQPSGNENGSVLARVAISPEVPEMPSVDSADQVPNDASASPHDIDNADRQPAHSADHPSEPPQVDHDANPPDPLQAILAYLTPIPNGKRLDQLAASMNLPEKAVQALLNTALNQGRLKKLGSRYLIP